MQTMVKWPDLTDLEVKAAEVISSPPPPSEERKFYPHTDLGNAELLIDLHGKDLRYCVEWNNWLVWKETHWVRDQKGILAGRLANLAARERYRQAADEEDAELRRATLTWARKSESSAARHNCLNQAMTLPGVAIHVSALDTSPWLLNVQNGTLNLQTGELLLHLREDLITKLSPSSYRPECKAPLWETMLGYSLTGDTRERVFFLNHGEGLNGKSTILETMLAVLGDDYAVVVNPDLLMTTKRDGDSPSPQLADLRGARFVLTSESRRGANLDESVVKRLTGGSDTIVARRLNENPVRFRPTHKIWMATNHRPNIEEATAAIWDRICLVPYQVRIECPDLELPIKLKAESDGILAWLVQGCLRWLREGLKPPSIVRKANRDYRQDSDELAFFLEAQTHQSQGYTTVESLYHTYCSWSAQFGEKSKTGREFSKMMKERGFEQKRTKRCFVWCGIGIKDVHSEDDRGDQAKITLPPIDHPIDHRENPYFKGTLASGDLGDPNFTPDVTHVESQNVQGPHGKLDHLDHLSLKDIDEIRLKGVIYSGDQANFLDHRGSPGSPLPPTQALLREVAL
jgi:putative DNA primase/helicase